MLYEVITLPMEGSTVAEVIAVQSGVMGEKLVLANYDQVSAETVVAYIHAGNKLATLVGFNQADVEEQVAKDVV